MVLGPAPIFRRSEPKYVQTEIRTMDLTIKCRTKNRIFKIKTTHQNPYRILICFQSTNFVSNLHFFLFPISIHYFLCTFFVSNLRILCPSYFNVSNLQFSYVCFQYIYHRFSDSHCLVMCSCDVVWCSTSLVLWKYRCSCVKSSKVVSISKMNFISSQKVKTAKLRKTWIGRTLFDWISNR